ncbi:MAG TPA: TIGR02679 domain-containing protein [Methylomusa anaerophila]|nr:TIGR02679 domain-containing protein [Methylomusa anaerophila]HML88347.1 TIGR02679 domain-containing protein [Methylomusa anaerophila]
MEAALRKHPATHRLQQAFERDPLFAVHMGYALQALGNLPEQYRRRPVFASEVCGDPHGLDGDSETGKLFLTGLKFVRDHFQELTDAWRQGYRPAVSLAIVGETGSMPPAKA